MKVTYDFETDTLRWFCQRRVWLKARRISRV